MFWFITTNVVFLLAVISIGFLLKKFADTPFRDSRESIFTVIGFVAASMVPPTVWVWLFPEGAATFFLVLYPFSVLATLMFGLPAFLLLRRLTPPWWLVVIVGAVIGAVVAVAIGLISSDPFAFIFLCPTGAFAAFVFHLCWKFGQRGSVERSPNAL